MSCDIARDKPESYIPIRLRAWRHPDKPAPVIAHLHAQTNVLICPVRWHPNYFRECDSWTFDKRTWIEDIATKGISIVHFHRRPTKGMKHGLHMIYRIAAEVFITCAHSSWDCTDREHDHPEKLHCPRPFFGYDKDLEEQPALGPLQPALNL